MPIDPLIRSGFTRRQANAMASLAKLEVVGPIRVDHTIELAQERVVASVNRGDVIMCVWSLVEEPWEFSSPLTPTIDEFGNHNWPGYPDHRGELYLWDSMTLSTRSLAEDLSDTGTPLYFYFGVEEVDTGAKVMAESGPLKLKRGRASSAPPLDLTAGASDLYILVARSS